jgi:hypothetical protein
VRMGARGPRVGGAEQKGERSVPTGPSNEEVEDRVACLRAVVEPDQYRTEQGRRGLGGRAYDYLDDQGEIPLAGGIHQQRPGRGGVHGHPWRRGQRVISCSCPSLRGYCRQCCSNGSSGILPPSPLQRLGSNSATRQHPLAPDAVSGTEFPPERLCPAWSWLPPQSAAMPRLFVLQRETSIEDQRRVVARWAKRHGHVIAAELSVGVRSGHPPFSHPPGTARSPGWWRRCGAGRCSMSPPTCSRCGSESPIALPVAAGPSARRNHRPWGRLRPTPVRAIPQSLVHALAGRSPRSAHPRDHTLWCPHGARWRRARSAAGPALQRVVATPRSVLPARAPQGS